MSRSTLEDYLNHQSEKLEQLIIATTLIQKKKIPAIASELTAVREDVVFLKDSLKTARDDLQTMKNQNESMKQLLNELDVLKDGINHMTLNIPPKLLHDYANMQVNNESESFGNGLLKDETPNCRSECNEELSDDVFRTDKENMVQNCKKILFNERESIPKIQPLDVEEFKLIPKYMIGRQTLDAVNQLVLTINQILEAKYSLLALGKNGAKKKGEFDLYMNYRKQECADSKEKGKVYFFTTEDYNRHTKTKLDKTKLNLLTVLRHCRRLREIRASKMIQYALILS